MKNKTLYRFASPEGIITTQEFASENEAFEHANGMSDDARSVMVQKRIGLDWFTWAQKGWEDGRWMLLHDETDAIEVMLRAQNARLAALK